MNSPTIGSNTSCEIVDEVHLVHGDQQPRDPEQGRDEGMALGLGQDAMRASMRMIARFAVEAPVAMLRVYCSWPGVSAMMKCRFGVEK